MTVKVAKNANKTSLKKALFQLDSIEKPIDNSKFIGKIKFLGDPVEFQRDLR